ncbi:MAG: class I adenylate-forming enzyme family protein [Acidimicrobiales bacterium]
MNARQSLIDQLTGPDGFFPVELQDVRGHEVPVLVNRKRSLRDFVTGSAAHGDAEFLVLGDRRITHEDFIGLVAAEAAALAADHGIGKGDRVAILAANSPDWVIAYFALVSMGAVVCLYNGWWTRDEIRHATELTTPSLILGDRKRLDRVPADLAVPMVDIDAERDRLQREAGEHELPAVAIDEDDACSIFFTSGTTGRSKGAVVSHRGLVGFVEVQMLNGALKMMMAAAQAEAAGDPPPVRSAAKPRVLMTSPLFHVSGLSGSTLINMFVGGTLVFREGRFDEEECFALVEKERITAWTLIGSMGPRVVDHPGLGDYDLTSLTNVGFGGAPASPELQQRVRDTFPNATANVAIGYGSSETVGVVASFGGDDYVAEPTATGHVLPTMQVEIRDDDNRAVADGINGRVCVRSAYSMLGYWDNPDATAETIDDGFWLDTGDVGRMVDGLLFIDSRARDMILHNGENVYPVEIEYRLDEHPGIQESAVYGLDDPQTGQAVAASVVPAPGQSLDEADLHSWCAESLARFKVPTQWDIRTEPLPRNAAGKVVKGALTGEREFTAHDD